MEKLELISWIMAEIENSKHQLIDYQNSNDVSGEIKIISRLETLREILDLLN